MLKYCTFKEAATTLNVTETEVRRVTREAKLERKKGYNLVSLRSLRKYRVNRHQRVPSGYISIKDAALASGLSEYVIRAAIDRKELKTKKFRRSLIIELKSFWCWLKILVDNGVFPLKTTKFLEGPIKVKNHRGLHTRPCGLIYEICKKYFHEGTKLTMKIGRREACGESLTDLLKLKACYGEYIKYRVEGDLCEDLLREIKRLFDTFEEIDKEKIESCKCDLMAVAKDIEISNLKGFH